MSRDLIKTLTSPIQDCMESYVEQFKFTNELVNILNTSTSTPIAVKTLLSKFDQDAVSSNERIQDFLKKLDKAAAQASTILLSEQSSILYPYIVGSWTTLEIAFNDLIVRILTNDPHALEKLKRNQISYSEVLINEDSAKKIFKEIRRKVNPEKKLGIYHYHKAILKLFDINLEYSETGVKLVEEINLIRNCIVHYNGTAQSIDLKIKSIPITLGQKIPSNNLFFIRHAEILINYLSAWLLAIFSSYSSAIPLED